MSWRGIASSIATPTPLDDLKSRVSALKAEAIRLQQAATALVPQGSNVWDVVAEEAFAAAGSALTDELFGRRRLGSRTAKALLRGQRAAQRSLQQAVLRAQAQAIADRLKGEVESLRGSIDERTRNGLLTTLAEARNAHRPDTILRRCSMAMDRLLAYEPRTTNVLGPGGPSEDYRLLQRLETAMRMQIVAKLSAFSRNWWAERVPSDVRDAAEERKQRREATWPWNVGEDPDPIDYVDFADYAKIMTRRDNWRDAFEAAFRDPEALRTKLRELEPIRNDIAHSRPLNRTAREKLRLYAQDLLEGLKR